MPPDERLEALRLRAADDVEGRLPHGLPGGPVDAPAEPPPLDDAFVDHAAIPLKNAVMLPGRFLVDERHSPSTFLLARSLVERPRLFA